MNSYKNTKNQKNDPVKEFMIGEKEIRKAFKFIALNRKRYFTKEEFKKKFPFIPNDSVNKFTFGNSRVTFKKFHEILVEDMKDVKDYLKRTTKVRKFDPIEECFKIFDKQSTGYLSFPVLTNMLKRYGLSTSHDDLEYVLDEFDFDGDGRIGLLDFKKGLNLKRKKKMEKTEFLKKMIDEVNIKENFQEYLQESKLSNENKMNEVQFSFKTFDKDKIGEISLDTVELILSNIGMKVHVDILNEIIEENDEDHNKMIDLEEYIKMMCDE